MKAFISTEREFSPQIEFLSNPGEIINQLNRQEWDSWEAFRLRARAAELELFTGFDDQLLVYTHLREHWREVGLIPYAHQEATVRRVIGELRGRAILADEVGLGKTIEAGMIIKEYILRGLVKKVLILTRPRSAASGRPNFPKSSASIPSSPRAPLTGNATIWSLHRLNWPNRRNTAR